MQVTYSGSTGIDLSQQNLDPEAYHPIHFTNTFQVYYSIYNCFDGSAQLPPIDLMCQYPGCFAVFPALWMLYQHSEVHVESATAVFSFTCRCSSQSVPTSANHVCDPAKSRVFQEDHRNPTTLTTSAATASTTSILHPVSTSAVAFKTTAGDRG